MAGKKGTGPFDRALVRIRRARAQPLPGECFLYPRIIRDISERLADINRMFGTALLLGDSRLTTGIAVQNINKISRTCRADHTDIRSGPDIVCDEERLPFADQSFDLVISVLTLHTVNRVPEMLMDINRILRADGAFIAVFFGGETLRDLRYAFYAAEEKVTGQITPRISPMIEVQQAAGLLQSAGFAMPVVDRDRLRVTYKDLHSLFADLRMMGETNVLSERSRRPASRALFDQLEQIYARTGSNSFGKPAVVFDILWMTGWAPHRDQPKPLMPGSAKARIADALGVKEQKLEAWM